MIALNKMRSLLKQALYPDTKKQTEEKMTHTAIKDSFTVQNPNTPLPYKVCLDRDPCPHYFESQQKAYQWLLEHGKGHVKKRVLIEFAFPLEQKIAHEAWVNLT